MLQMLNVDAVMFGFHVDSIVDVPDVGGRMWRMTYEKNGAELIWLERKDEVKTFVIAFKTLPEDDTGVAHILEHSVLSGSEKFPAKSPFDELRKSSVCVFINAMTSRDVTYFPFSTRNDQDFVNLMEVYLDAVFHPLSLKSPMPFMQEGWHYEVANDELLVNGVVFNEMKGVFALPDRFAYREMISALYPDIVYGHDSGGCPEHIPELTYDKYCSFHKRFYHPSNARIFLDGNVVIKDVLKHLDDVFSEYGRIEVKTDIGIQEPVSRKVRMSYASTTTENKAFLVKGWAAGTFKDSVHTHALDILADYLCGSNESPLKKTLLDRQLCKDVSMFHFDYQVMPLILILKNTSNAKLDECRKMIEETLRRIVREGADTIRFNALINRDEFSERELNTGRPKGLYYFSRILRQWLYGGNPVDALGITRIYDSLRKGVDNGFFEEMIENLILKNNHHVEIVLEPNPTLAATNAERDRMKMFAIRAQMSDVQIAAVKDGLKQLKEYQNRVDNVEDIAKIPCLKSKDLPTEASPLGASITERDGVTIVKSKAPVDKIFYMSFYFPLKQFRETELVKIPLFARLHGKLKTLNHSALELQTLEATNVGRITYSTEATSRGWYLKVSMTALLAKKDIALAILKEQLLETLFEDEKEISAVLHQKRLAAERNVSDDGRAFGLRVAKRGVSNRWTVADILCGERQLRWLQQAQVDKSLCNDYAKLTKKIFCKEGLIVACTDNLPEDFADELLLSFAGGVKDTQYIGVNATDSVAYSIDGDTGFAVSVIALPKNVRVTGAMKVATKILSLEYLHREVREIGGAYGIMMRVTNSGTVDCMSYRDSNPQKTLKTMREIGVALRKFVESGVDIDRYIVATIAAMEPYLPPADEAARAIDFYLENRTEADENRLRREILSTDPEQLLNFADLLDSLAPTARTCIIGGRKQLDGIQENAIQQILL